MSQKVVELPAEEEPVFASLDEKIQHAYHVLRTAAHIAKTYYHAPLIIGYSGGKDSDVVLQLAMECLGKDDFIAQNSHTTVDAPETVYHIRKVFAKISGGGGKQRSTTHGIRTAILSRCGI